MGVNVATKRTGERRRIGIIGAGPGGLATAMLLTRAGADVTVFERLDRVGGRSGSITAPLGDDGGSFRFDMGPTFFLYPRVLSDIFAACGKQLDREVELIRLDPQYHLIFEAGGELEATSDMARLAEAVAKLSPDDARALPRFMADNRAKLAAFRPALESSFDSVRAFATPAMLRALPKLRPHRTVDGDLATYFRDPRVRLAFSFQSKYLGMSPFQCPSLFTILAFMEYEYGVWHPRGGCGALMDAMARIAGEQGTDIRLSEPVEEILFEGRRARGVRTASGTHRFDALVVNADFAHTMQTLVPDRLRPAWSDERIARKKFSCSTFMLYLGIEGSLDQLAHHTIYLSKDYRRNVQEIDSGLSPPQEPSFYVQNASITDDTLAPPGHSTLYVLVPVGNLTADGAEWPEIQARYRRLTLDRLARIGAPDIEARIRFEKMLTPVGWRDEMAIHRGATFNLAHSMRQMFHMRPRNRFRDIEGMYLVGGGTHPGSGLPVIFESAKITTRLLAEDLELPTCWDIPLATAAPAREPALADVL
jgi:phytoene desaturase